MIAAYCPECGRTPNPDDCVVCMRRPPFREAVPSPSLLPASPTSGSWEQALAVALTDDPHFSLSEVIATVTGLVQPMLDAKDAEIARLRDQVWRTTTCLNAAKAMIGVYKRHITRQRQRADKAEAELDQLADYGLKHRERAEQAEATLERVRAIPRQPHTSERVGDLGRAYTRGWESAIAALDAALPEPTQQFDGPGGNAEDCPVCSKRRDLPYPFICECPPSPALTEPARGETPR